VPDRVVTSAKSWLSNPHIDPKHLIEAAKRKINARRTDDDLPVHSFQSLIADLATSPETP
jgi:hypothetical protein